MLERLATDAEHHDLEAWEPALCATLYSYLVVAIRDSMSREGEPSRPRGKRAVDLSRNCAGSIRRPR